MLIDHSRTRDRVKRGGGVPAATLHESAHGAGDVLDLAAEQDPEQIVALDEAV